MQLPTGVSSPLRLSKRPQTSSAGSSGASRTRPYTRQRLTLIALLGLAAIGITLNLVVAAPFIPGLTWALAFAVVTAPLHRWISSRISNQSFAAALSVVVVALGLALPTAFIMWQVGRQAGQIATVTQDYLQSGAWADRLERNPTVGRVWKQVEQVVDIEEEAKNVGDMVQQSAIGWMQTAVWGGVQLLIALFALFYFFRDHAIIARVLRSLMPMSNKEADHVFTQIQKMTHATIYGTLVVAAVQGALSGLMFWILGFPGALLWGAVMGLLAIIPVLGAFVIWMPAAIFLAAQGDWGKAVILVGWGTVVVGLIDNLLYPSLVGSEMRLHTLPVFIAIVGGLFVFGGVGIVLGPIILAGTIAIIDILRRRTVNGRSAEQET